MYFGGVREERQEEKGEQSAVYVNETATVYVNETADSLREQDSSSQEAAPDHGTVHVPGKTPRKQVTRGVKGRCATGLYAVPDATQTVIYNKRRPRDGERGQRGDTDNIYESLDDVTICDVPGPQEDMRDNTAGRHTQGQCSNTVRNAFIAVFLMMCLILLGVTVIMGLAVYYIAANNNLTLERNQFERRYKNFTMERNQLQSEVNQLRRESEAANNNLTLERNQFEIRYKNFTMERNLSQSKINQLSRESEAANNNLTLERNEFEIKYQNISIERNRLQSEVNQFRRESADFAANNKLTLERYQNERNQLQSEVNQLRREIAVKSCPNGWKRFGCSCYYRSSFSEWKTWEESRKECLKAGADLVIINSKEEQEFILSLEGAPWIGLARTDGGNWTWLDGTPSTTQYWASGFPDKREDRNYTYIYGGKWRNSRDVAKARICEK